MSQHCSQCGKLMQHRRRTFSRAGGYTCINRNCPESPLFHYRGLRTMVFSAAYKAQRVKAGLDI